MVLSSLPGILLNSMKIPKIIYSTWISDIPFPKRFQKYIESWKKFLPDYEIRMITLENTPRNSFIDTFINMKKFAVAAQYARAQKIYETGGLYFDIDVEIIKNFDDMLSFDFFAGVENKGKNNFINNAVFGACKDHSFMKDCMNYMDNIDVKSENIEVGTGPLMFTELMKQRGWVPENVNTNLNGIRIFSSEYFYPYRPDEQFKPECIKKNTYAVHHWAATWKNSVSVIIPCFHYTNTLTELVEIIKKQTVRPIEIIIINKADDFNAELIKNIAGKHNVKVIETKSVCNTSVKNDGIEFAKGKWILILKPDEFIDENFIEKTIDKGDIVIMNNIAKDKEEIQNIDHSLLKEGYLLFRREVWEEISGFNETMIDGYADLDFLKRAQANGFNISIVSK